MARASGLRQQRWQAITFMPSWLIKTALQRTISWLPRRQFWNGLLQTWVTKSTELDAKHFEEKLRECQRHVAAFQSLRPDLSEFRVLEVGTGWFPIIPAGLYLCGARELRTIDIEPLLRRKHLQRMLEAFCAWEQSGELRRTLPGYRAERMDRLRALLPRALREEPAALLRELDIEVLVGDAQRLALPGQTIDFFISSGVLECIPRPVLEGILAESRRVAAPGAVMSHRLNLADQFSYFDSSITAFNFLRYTEGQWRWRNSPMTWQNRLRIPDYRQMFRAAGFEVVREENVSGRAEDLARIKLAPPFERYRLEDLLVLHSFLTARLAPAGEGGLSDKGERRPSGDS